MEFSVATPGSCVCTVIMCDGMGRPLQMKGGDMVLVEVNHPYMTLAVVLVFVFCGHSLVHGSNFTTVRHNFCCLAPEKHCPLQFDIATALST